MCYSAKCWAHWHRYRREFNAWISIRDFAELYGYKRRAKGVYTPKAMDAAFLDPLTSEEAEIKAIIEDINAADAQKFEKQLFTQTARRVKAERSLAVKASEKAHEELRISTNKILHARRKLDDLNRTDPVPEDSDIYPFWYAPVMVMEEGRLVVKPMRYHCRLDGWNAAMEGKYGTYNARRDSLSRTWKKIFGYQHGLMMVDRFYEHVPRHKVEGRELRSGEEEQDTILEFIPQPSTPMLVACLWNHSKGWGDEADFYSFAAITDEPPKEVAAAGHDRCIIPIKREHLQTWLTPDPGKLDQLQAILEDRDRPYYEHRLAA